MHNHLHDPDPAFTQLLPAVLLGVLLYGEARGCSLAGLKAVAYSVRNRVDSGKWYGGDLTTVILRYEQYDALWPALGGPNYAATLAFAKRLGIIGYTPMSIEWLCLEVASDSAVGPDTTDGATHYYDESIARPNWAAPPARETLVVDKLHFYANVA